MSSTRSRSLPLFLKALFCHLAFLLFLLPSTFCFAQEHIRTLEVEIFATPDPLPIQAPVQEFFGGMLLWLQFMDVLSLGLMIVALIVGLAFLRSRLNERLWLVLSLGLASLLSVMFSLKISQGWDELFINLRHSYVFAQTGHFSYNLKNMMEGTVDFLPFLLAGILGKLSFPLVESIISITLLGNILVIVASWAIAYRVTKDQISAVFFATGIGILPCVVFVGGTGFTATLFSAVLLGAIYFLFFCDEDRRPWGLFLLAILTLVRAEGIAFAVVIWGYLYVLEVLPQLLSNTTRRTQLKKSFMAGLYLAAPFILSLIIRQIAFGYPIPNPITFKNVAGDPDYFTRGIAQLRHTINLFYLPLFFFVALGPYIHGLNKKLFSLRILGCVTTTAAVCFIYFTGGGDWFPLVWNRYMMPFTILFILLCWAVTRVFFGQLIKNPFILGLISFALVFIPFAARGHYSAFEILRYDLQTNKNRWERIDSLGYFGRYLKMTTPPDTVIASPEMATVMYFADRDIVDLLGIASPEIAHAPLNPLVPGDLMHRRRFPQTIEKHRPGIVGFWGMDLFQKPSSQTREGILNDFARFQFTPAYQGFTYFDIAYYRGGSYDYLLNLGYHYLIISTPQAMFSYLVHDSLYKTHIEHLKHSGIHSLGKTKFGYTINTFLEQRFSAKEK